MLGQYFDILVLLVVVVVIFHRLRNVLGSQPTVDDKKIAEENAAKIINMIMKEAEKNSVNNNAANDGVVIETNKQNNNEVFGVIDEVLVTIPNFDKNKFIHGAKRAFEVIVDAFAKGDVATLEMLVSKKLLNKFQDVIDNRRADGITAEMDFIGFDSAEIIDAKISNNNVANVIVKFVSEQVNLLKNNNGDVIEGDDKFIQNITDVWTFERILTSANPNWILVSTKKC